MPTKQKWFVYMLRCNDGSLYSGITVDVKRRVFEHNEGVKGKGAKYTAARRPVTLVYKESCLDRASAASAEAALKKLPKSAKEKLVKNH